MNFDRIIAEHLLRNPEPIKDFLKAYISSHTEMSWEEFLLLLTKKDPKAQEIVNNIDFPDLLCSSALSKKLCKKCLSPVTTRNINSFCGNCYADLVLIDCPDTVISAKKIRNGLV